MSESCSHHPFTVTTLTELNKTYKDKFVKKGLEYSFNTRIDIIRIVCEVPDCLKVCDKLLFYCIDTDAYKSGDEWSFIGGKFLTPWT